jgi:Ca2+-binding EF-hand superfamily protein
VQVYQLFLDIDANGDGIIDTKELRKALKRFGYNLTDAEVEQLMLRMDLNHVRCSEQECNCNAFDEAPQNSTCAR